MYCLTCEKCLVPHPLHSYHMRWLIVSHMAHLCSAYETPDVWYVSVICEMYRMRVAYVSVSYVSVVCEWIACEIYFVSHASWKYFTCEDCHSMRTFDMWNEHVSHATQNVSHASHCYHMRCILIIKFLQKTIITLTPTPTPTLIFQCCGFDLYTYTHVWALSRSPARTQRVCVYVCTPHTCGSCGVNIAGV